MRRCPRCRRELDGSWFSPKAHSYCKPCARQVAHDTYAYAKRMGTLPDNLPAEKRECMACHIIKAGSEFSRAPKNPTGLASYCRPCGALKARQWRAARKLKGDDL